VGAGDGDAGTTEVVVVALPLDDWPVSLAEQPANTMAGQITATAITQRTKIITPHFTA
jgi:hypothetical protein